MVETGTSGWSICGFGAGQVAELEHLPLADNATSGVGPWEGERVTNVCRFCHETVPDDVPWCPKCHPPRRETAADVVKVLREIAGLDPTP